MDQDADGTAARLVRMEGRHRIAPAARFPLRPEESRARVVEPGQPWWCGNRRRQLLAAALIISRVLASFWS